VRPEATSGKFTYEDFLHFPDDGKRHEIIDGEHYVTPSPNTKHQHILGHLYFALVAYLRNRRVGEVFVAPFDVVFSDRDIVEPDLLYISRERSSILTDQHVRGAPDLVVEVLSPSTRSLDETKKRDLYESFGVHEYWVVDPELDTIRIDRRVEGAFVRSAELAAEKDDELTTPLLPGFSVRLAEVFESPFPASERLHP
jgi:Uma2 family endonuclease